MRNTQIHILQTGYGFVDDNDVYHASATCTLVIADEMNVIVDPGGVWETEKIKEKLKSFELTEDDINVVVGTHGHSDHIGNINLFPAAKQIIGFDINVGDQFESHDFKSGLPYVLVENKLEVVPTPGHMHHDVSLVVYGAVEYGTVGICGDLFEKENDEMVWADVSESPVLQEENRKKMLSMCHYIVPGHGWIFKNLKCVK